MPDEPEPQFNRPTMDNIIFSIDSDDNVLDGLGDSSVLDEKALRHARDSISQYGLPPYMPSTIEELKEELDVLDQSRRHWINKLGETTQTLDALRDSYAELVEAKRNLELELKGLYDMYDELEKKCKALQELAGLSNSTFIRHIPDDLASTRLT